MELYALLRKPDPQIALAIGYWLSAAGLTAFAGGFAAKIGEAMWTGQLNGAPMSCFDRGFLLVVGPPLIAIGVVWGLWSACVLVLTPLQLGGATRGIVSPCDSWWCWINFDWWFSHDLRQVQILALMPIYTGLSLAYIGFKGLSTICCHRV